MSGGEGKKNSDVVDVHTSDHLDCPHYRNRLGAPASCRTDSNSGSHLVGVDLGEETAMGENHSINTAGERPSAVQSLCGLTKPPVRKVVTAAKDQRHASPKQGRSPISEPMPGEWAWGW